MKPLFIILITLISLEVVSCKKDPAVSIMGKWNLVSDELISGQFVDLFNFYSSPGSMWHKSINFL